MNIRKMKDIVTLLMDEDSYVPSTDSEFNELKNAIEVDRRPDKNGNAGCKGHGCCNITFLWPTKESIFVVGGKIPQHEGSTLVDELLVGEQLWREQAPLSGRRRDHAAAVIKVDDAAQQEGDEKLLIGVFGGCFKEGDTWTYLASCEVYEVSQNSITSSSLVINRWHKLPNLRQMRSGPAAASLPGANRVFVFGGRDDTHVYSSVEFCYLRANWE
ncbi:unnamed protein product [Dibothriocephalus latus]|uniref:Uncharacterized protein n=1 Tax=Dibothriocephalus latus TaxID=60516 RepID=A0A3P7LGE7_DIBLA|nr:unnamed protein product [Dibothriocephalus latus]